MNIQEAIKILNKFCEYEDAVVLTENVLIEIQEAIEIVLGNLEALADMQKTSDIELENARKIKEEHKRENEELRQKVKELEEELYSANKIVEEYLDGVPKQKIKNIMKELNNEYKKIDDSIDIYSNSDDRGKIDCLQMIGWLEGKLQELLQESEG